MAREIITEEQARARRLSRTTLWRMRKRGGWVCTAKPRAAMPECAVPVIRDLGALDGEVIRVSAIKGVSKLMRAWGLGGQELAPYEFRDLISAACLLLCLHSDNPRFAEEGWRVMVAYNAARQFVTRERRYRRHLSGRGLEGM